MFLVRSALIVALNVCQGLTSTDVSRCCKSLSSEGSSLRRTSGYGRYSERMVCQLKKHLQSFVDQEMNSCFQRCLQCACTTCCDQLFFCIGWDIWNFSLLILFA